jgi:hypothetical protein
MTVRVTVVQAVERLRQARQEQEQAAAAFEAATVVFPLVAAAQARLKVAKQATAEADSELRALAIFTHAVQDELPAGVTVVVGSKVEVVDEGLAYAWAKEHKLGLIPERADLDVLRGLVLGGTPVDGLQVVEVPQVRIASKLPAPIEAAIVKEAVQALVADPLLDGVTPADAE